LAAAVSAWACFDLTKDEKPGAMFLIADDQVISAHAFCGPPQSEPACMLTELGVKEFDHQLLASLKLDPLCNGLPIFLEATVAEAAKNQAFTGTSLYLYVDYYPGRLSADWSLSYHREARGFRAVLLDLMGRPAMEEMRPIDRGNIADIASETCSLADLKKGK
jgi:hypothetical protein